MPGRLVALIAARPVLLAFAAAAAFAATCFAVLGLRSDPLVHGNVLTDQRAIVAARQFQRAGAEALHGLQVVDARHELGRKPWYYDRHPPGGARLLAFLLDHGFDVRTARIVPLLASTVGLLGFFFCIRDGLAARSSAATALLALGLLAAAPPFHLMADALQFFSYGLLVKGLGFLLAVRAGRTGGGRGILLLVLAAFLAWLGVTQLGLETLPALGLFAVIHPLIAGEGRWRRRFALAGAGAALIAGAMALGWSARLSTMDRAHGDPPGTAFARVVSSLGKRAAGATPASMGEEGYGTVLGRRLLSYVPGHLLLAGLGALALAARRLREGRRAAGPGARLLAAFALSEGLYFAFMRQHVQIHVHTLLHLTFTLALAAALGVLELARARAPMARPVAAMLAAAVIVGSPLLLPARPEGNVVPRSCAGWFLPVYREFDALAAGLPAESVLVVAAPAPLSWDLRYLAVRRGFSPLVLGAGLTRLDDALALAVASGRPAYAIVPGDAERALGGLSGVARRIAEGPRFTILAAGAGSGEPALEGR